MTFAPRLKKETGKINWNANAFDIVNLIRGLSPRPPPTRILEGQVLKIFAAEAEKGKVKETPGTIDVQTDRRTVRCGIRRLCDFKRCPTGRKEKIAGFRIFCAAIILNPKIILDKHYHQGNV